MLRLALLVFLLAAPAIADGFGGEVALGAGFGSDRQGDGHIAPVASALVDYEGPFWVAGLRGLLVFGPKGQTAVPGSVMEPDSAGFRAWGLLAEGGLHTSGPLQFQLRASAGIGQLVRIQCDCTETPGLEGNVAPMFALAAGVRGRIAPRLSVGLEIGGVLFTGIGHLPGSWDGYSPPESELIRMIGQVMLSASWSSR